jgi:hypothetical protein
MAGQGEGGGGGAMLLNPTHISMYVPAVHALSAANPTTQPTGQ